MKIVKKAGLVLKWYDKTMRLLVYCSGSEEHLPVVPSVGALSDPVTTVNNRQPQRTFGSMHTEEWPCPVITPNRRMVTVCGNFVSCVV
jgi:hypothetical protein